MDIEKNIIKGVLYSKFDIKVGPVAIAWTPSSLSNEMRDLISLKSINILTGENNAIPESLAIIPFPSLNFKGIIKLMEIKDQEFRGGIVNSSITVLFHEENDLIFYKYMHNFETVFDETIDKIIELEEKKADRVIIEEEIRRFHAKLINILRELYEIEVSEEKQDEFPMTIQKTTERKWFNYKIILCGDKQVGKTSIALRFTDRAFRRTYIPTMGVNISEKDIQIDEKTVTFTIWDIAGHSKFQIMRRHFYQGADGILLVFDLTNPESFRNISKWDQDVNYYLNADIGGLILGNKSDLGDERKVDKMEIRNLAEELGFEPIETSALSGENVEEAFFKLGELLIKEKFNKN